MKIGNIIQTLQTSDDLSSEKSVIVDADGRDGMLLAAFLSANFDKDQILVIHSEQNNQEGS